MNELKKIRYDRGLSQVALSRLSEVHPSRISLIESGSTIPTANEMKRISGAVGLLPEEVFGLDPVIRRLTASGKKEAEK